MTIDIIYIEDHNILRIIWIGPFSCPQDGPEMMSKAKPIIEKNNCLRLLFDHRNAQVIDDVTNTFKAGRNADKLGFEKKYVAAILYSEDERKHMFIETVMRNRGYQIKIFDCETKAINWLSKH